MGTKPEPNYKELVAEAEKAVAGVKDPELRRAAFEKVLDQLLAHTVSEHKATAKEVERRPTAPSRRAEMSAKRGPRAYIEELIHEGYFKRPQTLSQVKAELANRGHHMPRTSLSGPLQKLCQEKQLRRQKSKGNDNKTIYRYSNW